ncbi:hypothetical protein [Planctomicrobium sp. SH664]|uniref:EF-hand domain-containing protein n=1 Tax=Planctomicrobium sp. SH664 TaxID=3448125 RepID=UPI003F5B2ADA
MRTVSRVTPALIAMLSMTTLALAADEPEVKKPEAKKGTTEQAAPKKHEKAKGRRQHKSLFDRLDANGDGSISREEFAKAGKKMKSQHRTAARGRGGFGGGRPAFGQRGRGGRPSFASGRGFGGGPRGFAPRGRGFERPSFAFRGGYGRFSHDRAPFSGQRGFGRDFGGYRPMARPEFGRGRFQANRFAGPGRGDFRRFHFTQFERGAGRPGPRWGGEGRGEHGPRPERGPRPEGDRPGPGPRREGEARGEHGPRPEGRPERGPRPEGDRPGPGPRWEGEARGEHGPRPEGRPERGSRPEGDRPGPSPRREGEARGEHGPRPEGRPERGPRPEGDRPGPGPRREGEARGEHGPRPEGRPERGPRPEGDRPGPGPRREGEGRGERGPRPEGRPERGPRPEGDRPGPRPEGREEESKDRADVQLPVNESPVTSAAVPAGLFEELLADSGLRSVSENLQQVAASWLTFASSGNESVR